MSHVFSQEVGRLRSTRVALRLGLLPVPFAVALVFFVADASVLLGWPSESMVGITMALISPFGLWWAPKLMELMHAPCPRCSEPFFGGPERALATLFLHRAHCSSCGLSLHAEHPISRLRDASSTPPPGDAADREAVKHDAINRDGPDAPSLR